MSLRPAGEDRAFTDATLPSMAPWIPQSPFLFGQLELVRGFLNVAEVSDDPLVAHRNLVLAERALQFVQQHAPHTDSEAGILRACEELSERTRALTS